MKNAQVKAFDLLIVVIFVSAAYVGFTGFINEQATAFGVTGVDTGFNSSFNRYQAITNTTEDIRTMIQSGSLFSISGFDALFTGAVAVAKLLLNTIFMPISLITDILTVLGLPGWAINMIYVIVSLIVCFTIINFIVGRSEL